MAAPHTSIFISHRNVAPGAEPVFDALIDEKQGLRSKLGDEYAAYELFWDRQIEAAADWRTESIVRIRAGLLPTKRGRNGFRRKWDKLTRSWCWSLLLILQGNGVVARCSSPCGDLRRAAAELQSRDRARKDHRAAGFRHRTGWLSLISSGLDMTPDCR